MARRRPVYIARDCVPSALVASIWQHLRARDERPRPAVKAKLRVTNEAGGPARIDLMDEIGFWGVTAQDFVDELLAIDASVIELHVNSPGGDVFDGVAIMNALADHPATVNVIVDGLAASAVSFIAMAGDTVKMNRGSQMMIHDALGLCVGNAAEMDAMSALLSRVSDMIADIYATRGGETTEHWRDLMRAETWYSATEAVEAGLADVAVSGAKAAEPDEDADEDPDEESDEDEEDDENAPAAKFAASFSRFVYNGRAQAPAPPTPGNKPVAQFDPAAFRAAIREGVSP
jgi:ATP-dependent protease ClpP protease subunit